MSITSKVRTIFWFLLRPKYYSQLYALIVNRITGDSKERTREESETWCENQAVCTKDFLESITKQPYVILSDLFPDEFKKAHVIVESLPVKMGGAGDLELLYFLTEHVQATKVVETGVANGWSSLSILLSLVKRNGARLVSTDMPYPKMGNERYVGCIVPDELKTQWHLIRKPDVSGLPQALQMFDDIDLCHYDSDKTYKGRMFAYPMLWEKLNKNGIFVSDDIGDNLGFKDFCKSISKTPYIIKGVNRYVGVLIKND